VYKFCLFVVTCVIVLCWFLHEVGRIRQFSSTCAWWGVLMAYNVVVVFLSWQLILPHLTVVQASTHWVVTEDGRIQAQVISLNHQESSKPNTTKHSTYSESGLGVAPGHQNAISVVSHFLPNDFLTTCLEKCVYYIVMLLLLLLISDCDHHTRVQIYW